MKNLGISERRHDPVLILDLKGDIRLGKGNVTLHRVLRELVQRGEKNILLNLSDVTDVDSSGLGALIAGRITIRKSGGELKLLNLTKRVRELMVITKLLMVFNVYQTESEAVRSFQPFFKNTDAKEAASAVSA
jgi:anti-sigma B factor antagonist